MDLDEPLLLRGCCSFFVSLIECVWLCDSNVKNVYVYIQIGCVFSCADGIKAYCIDAVKFSIEFTYELIHTYINMRPSHTQRIFRK